MENKIITKTYLLDSNNKNALLDSFKKKMKLIDKCTYKKTYHVRNIFYKLNNLSNNSIKVRTYKYPLQQTLYLEVKDSNNINTIELSNEEFDLWIKKGFKPNRYDNSIVDNISGIILNNPLLPYLFTSYDRLSYYYLLDSNLSIDIDENIRYSKSNLFFNQYSGDLLIPLDQFLFTISYSSILPSWLEKIINTLNLVEYKCNLF